MEFIGFFLVVVFSATVGVVGNLCFIVNDLEKQVTRLNAKLGIDKDAA